MKSTQKMIKYMATLFAFFLIFNIIASIMFGLMALDNLFGEHQTNYDNMQIMALSEDANVIEIDVASVNVILKEGEHFRIETNSEHIENKQKGNQISIQEADNFPFFNLGQGDLVVYIPDDFNFDYVSIKNGAGKVIVEELNTETFVLNQGIGKVEINKLNVFNKAEIDGGVGTITMKKGSIDYLDLDMGLGTISITTKINKGGNVEAGIGVIDLILLGNAEDYQVVSDKGIGTINVDTLPQYNDIYGKGDIPISINGGIGSINVLIQEK